MTEQTKEKPRRRRNFCCERLQVRFATGGTVASHSESESDSAISRVGVRGKGFANMGAICMIALSPVCWRHLSEVENVVDYSDCNRYVGWSLKLNTLNRCRRMNSAIQVQITIIR